MRVALVHDWLTGMRGGENVLEELCQLFPDADLYTLLHIKGSVSPMIENREIKTSFLQKIPGVSRRYRWFLPLMPKAIESFDLAGYDLVISSSHCVAKGINPGTAKHICYCHTPMRYAWDMYDHYFNRQRYSAATLFAIEKIMPRLRRWDISTVSNVDRFIANSLNVQERIKRIYKAPSEVIYPPVDTGFYEPAQGAMREKYLIVSAFAPYKRIDLAIETFNISGKPLVILGSGEDEKRLRKMAGPSIIFEPSVSKEKLREFYQNARALIFPGEEDFGIIPVEAMACGTPVIAFGKGGVKETVTPLRDDMTGAPTGLFFDHQKTDDLALALEKFEANENIFNTDTLRNNAMRFAKNIFREKIKDFVAKNMADA